MRVMIPLPDTDFDVTEVAVPWRLLRDAGHEVVFATERGAAAPAADPRLLDGVLFGQLGAEPEPIAFYRELLGHAAYRAPLPWGSLDMTTFDGLLLAGGHAPGMRPYLESERVQAIAAAAFQANKPVSAICHGVIPLVRAKGSDGRALLYGRRTTALTGGMENFAVSITRQALGNHYRTYPQSVEDEVRANLAKKSDFKTGPLFPRYATETKPDRGFVVRDGNYISARWPGDAWTLATAFCRMV